MRHKPWKVMMTEHNDNTSASDLTTTPADGNLWFRAARPKVSAKRIASCIASVIPPIFAVFLVNGAQTGCLEILLDVSQIAARSVATLVNFVVIAAAIYLSCGFFLSLPIEKCLRRGFYIGIGINVVILIIEFVMAAQK